MFYKTIYQFFDIGGIYTYHENGDFGQVRLAGLVTTLQSEGLFWLNSVGWHRCNDRYQITHPDGNDVGLILITVDGCGMMELDGTEYSLPKGTVAFIPRNVPNMYKTPVGGIWEFYWIHPSGKVCELFQDAMAQKGVFLSCFDKNRSYPQQMERLISLCSERDSDTALYISQQISTILHMAASDLYLKPQSVSLSSAVSGYIEQHYKESFTLDDIAEQLFVSTAHLIRVFKKENGCTPHQYLMKYRLLSAVQLLKFSDMNIDSIALQVGFSSSSHFISSFKREYGCTPTHYIGRSADRAHRADLSAGDLVT